MHPVCPAPHPSHPPGLSVTPPALPRVRLTHAAPQGDSGGPLVWERNGLWYQVGIVSWGVGCGRPNWHVVYTNISRYFNWIRMLMVRSGLPRPEPCPLLLLALLCAPPVL